MKNWTYELVLIVILAFLIFSIPQATAENNDSEEWHDMVRLGSGQIVAQDSIYFGLFFGEDVAFVGFEVEPKGKTNPENFVEVKYKGIGENCSSTIYYDEEDESYKFPLSLVKFEKTGCFLYPFSNYETTFKIEGENIRDFESEIKVPNKNWLQGEIRVKNNEIKMEVSGNTLLHNLILFFLVFSVLGLIFFLSMEGFKWSRWGVLVSLFTSWGGVYLILELKNLPLIPISCGFGIYTILGVFIGILLGLGFGSLGKEDFLDFLNSIYQEMKQF